jgi:hypothetical protein
MKRMWNPQEIANGIAWLCSDESLYATAISWPSMGALVLARDFPIVRKDFACDNDVSFVSKITRPLRKGQVAIHP